MVIFESCGIGKRFSLPNHASDGVACGIMVFSTAEVISTMQADIFYYDSLSEDM